MAKIAAWTDDIVLPELPEEGEAEALEPGAREVIYVEVTFEDGRRTVYPEGHVVDVYYEGAIKRVSAGELRPGQTLAVLVDEIYGSLYERLIEVVNARRDPRQVLLLDLWRRVKLEALRRHRNNRRELHRSLAQRALTVDYAAVTTWFRTGDEETLAPQSDADFQILAEAGGLDRPDIVQRMLQAIRTERGFRRTLGRRLATVLRQIAAGADFEVAIKTAGVIGTEVEQVASATELRGIADAHRVDRAYALGAVVA
jgi:hypothetical protein